VVLVGPPGAGKSAPLSYSEKILRQIDGVCIAPSSVTTASLIDTLQLSVRKVLHPYFMQFNSLQVVASELQNFLPAYEASFMGILTKLYDCELYEERRRTGKVQHIRIDNTQLSLLAGTTPSYLSTLLPEGAWDQGFTSRTIFIFSEKRHTRSNLFHDDEEDAQFYKELEDDVIYDLRAIMNLNGQVIWSNEAKAAIHAWVAGGEQVVPDHARLTHYNTRRVVHLLKLSLIASISRGNTMSVQPRDFEVALAWLLEAESFMPDIFRAMSTTPESRSMDDAHHYIREMFRKLQGGVPEHYLVGFLKHRTTPQNIQKMIEVMVKSRMIRHEYDKSGNSSYYPL